jgi:hypothetical protein
MNKLARKVVHFVASNLVVKQKHDSIVIENYRKSICQQCEYFNKQDLICEACKCLLDVKWKSLVHRKVTTGEIQITHCVKQKWNDGNIADYYKSKEK